MKIGIHKIVVNDAGCSTSFDSATKVDDPCAKNRRNAPGIPLGGALGIILMPLAFFPTPSAFFCLRP